MLKTNATKNIYILSNNALTLLIDGKATVINQEHVNYKQIETMVKESNPDWKAIEKLLNVKQTVLDYCGKSLNIENGVFTYTNSEGTKVSLTNHALIDKIMDAYREGRDYNHFIAFLDNLVQNPSKDAIEELFLFLQANELPLTDDGHFLAYKRVNGNFKDCYSNTFDNSVGSVVKMDRSKCNANRHETCSSGLHFCSRGYLGSFSGENIVVAKINPKDVVSIPDDYNNSKGRCCEYQVIACITNKESQDLKKYVGLTLEQVRKDLGSAKIKAKIAENKISADHITQTEVPQFSSLKKAYKGIKKSERFVGMLVDIVNAYGTKNYAFIGNIRNEDLKPYDRSQQTVACQVFSSVDDARRNCKDRKIGMIIRIKNSFNDSNYQFIGGTSNKHLKKIQ